MPLWVIEKAGVEVLLTNEKSVAVSLRSANYVLSAHVDLITD